MKKLNVLVMSAFVLALFSTQAFAIDFRLLEATPIGSWQEREEMTTDHKGRKTAAVMRSSLLGTEQRNGKPYYWIEMVVESYKINKKGKRKKDGDRVIIKTLVAKSALEGDPANLLTNLKGFGEEMIMQSGKEKPMRMTGSGGMMAGLMKAAGTEVNYSFKEMGNETVTVPAGQFSTVKIEGSGSTETKVIFKKIKIDSTSTAWMSADVPFGFVKSDGTSTMNGKKSTHQSELLAFGMSGAESQITGEPQDMPSLGNIFGK